jgi:7-keto-8-aminopelargonate synthetase-like enzyme
MSSARVDCGSTKLHDDLEKLVARFLNKEAAIVYTMVRSH